MKTFLILLLALFIFSCERSETDTAECCSTKPKTNQIEAGSLPGTSLYHIKDVWRDQHNKPFQLEDFHGKKVILSMFFTHCAYACPMLVSEIKAIENQLSETERSQLTILLISFDDERDTPERLKEYAMAQELGSNWKLLQGNKSAIQTVAVALGISYDLMDNGQYAHSNRKVLLDKAGTIAFTQDGLGTPAMPMVEAFKKQ